MAKVRDVLERAYGAIPEGATCHVGFINGFDEGVVGPTYCHDKSRVYSGGVKDGAGQWGWEISEGIYGGDISECDAAAFSPVFGCAAYDAALDALTKAQPDPRRVIALADAMVDNPIYRTSYMEASREFWAALSADGTGESPVLSTHLDVMGEGK